MIFIATLLLVGLIVGSGYWYSKLVPETSSTAWKTRSAIRGAMTFMVIFLAFNSLIDGHMPRFFLRFINKHGDPAGVSIVLMLSAALNYLAAKHFFTRKAE